MDDRMQKICKYAEGPTILDLGAVQHELENTTEEWLHAYLVEEFDNVVGVDVLEDEIDALRKRGYDMQFGDVTDMDLGIMADTVVAGELIEHLTNPGALVETAFNHLKPGGLFILTTPNPWAIVHLRRWWSDDPQINDNHVAWYGPIVLKQLLNRYGFDVERMETTRRNHGGLMRIAQYFNNDIFGGTTWVCVARRPE
ncbi:type 11 methyltransferase [Halovivax asiaticus JCM 14624]|uniref:Type 11 methyltransferase n=1 Tax=Halovivax asiaticus JCM 14624 TaxID=1227490 RepID=M0BS97_9EURY|nr:class I SAM-dependent methyltransferase [Halovivax asiaticus]ELZ13886.1 type 11 methyltransferase [Halovivax asiaticus JCM 14624]